MLTLFLSLEIALGPFAPRRPVERLASNVDRFGPLFYFLFVSAYLYFAHPFGALIYRFFIVHSFTVEFFVSIFSHR